MNCKLPNFVVRSGGTGCFVLWAILFVAAPSCAGDEVGVFTDYADAVERAKDEHKMLLIAFHEPGDVARWRDHVGQLSGQSSGRELLVKHVIVLLPTDHAWNENTDS